MTVSLLGRKDSINASRKPALLYHGTSASTVGLAVVELLHQEAIKNPILICPSDEYLASLEDSIQFFSKFLGLETPEICTVDSPSSPYSRLLPVPQERWQRIQVLATLQQSAHSPNSKKITILTASAALRTQLSPSDWQSLTRQLKVGDEFAPQQLEALLLKSGYERRDLVEDPGTYSLRGGIVDFFPPGDAEPWRIEYFDTTIETIRRFNTQTQRSQQELWREAAVLPAREFDCSPSGLQLAREKIKVYCDELEIPKVKRDHLSELLQRGIAPLELDHLLPIIQDRPHGIWEHTQPDSTWVIAEPELCQQNSQAWEKKLEQDFALLRDEKEIIPVPEKSFFTWDEFSKAARLQVWFSRLDLYPEHEAKVGIKAEPVALNLSSTNQWDQLDAQLRQWTDAGFQVVFVANSETQIDRFGFFLHRRGFKFLRDHRAVNHVSLYLGSLPESFILLDQHLVFLAEDDIFGRKLHGKRPKSGHQSHRKDVPHLRSLDHLHLDELVVHLEHGIGRYKGLVTLKTSGVSGDFVILEYADKDKLYLPIYHLNRLQKYIGAGGHQPALDRLGSQQFTKAKDRVKEAVRDIAADLLKLYAQRSTLRGYAFSPPDEVYEAFSSSFPYDETPDQSKAIKETLRDMCSVQPMDRLVCGDVGFGKTEVALRAALKACLDHKQVAVLVPTTVLAEQHFQTFSQRFRNLPIRIASLSRFRSRKEQTEILAELKAGKIDIIIGTHRLLSKDVHFADLGLMVVDEEQRFGVEHKERLKQFKLNTDVLTLTATPIPRTLHMALMGLRDISLIQTAPSNRLPIRTHLSPYNTEVIKNAIETEIRRGGQVFFLHNRVQTIDKMRRELAEILPKIRIGVAHGQMPERELEKVMLGFYHHDFDILLSTAIIENGLDVPNANTIIIDRADTFGLSQLYQLRGRVGRSRTRAFAYLLVPEGGRMTDEARERLHIIQQFIELGSGYSIASHDLEMRGGGDLLGAAQSGHVALVGYDLYLELLQEEVSRLKGEAKPVEQDVEVGTEFPAFIPDDYVQDMRTRLSLYKRLSEAISEEELSDGLEEMRERFGIAPDPVEELFALLRLKLLLKRIGMRGVQIKASGLTLTAGPDPQVSEQALLNRVAQQPKNYAFLSDGRLSLRFPVESIRHSIDVLRNNLPGLSS